REPIPHVPDTVPGKRVPGPERVRKAEASRQTSEVGAVCRKAARTVLCGGRPVMGVPTAIGGRARRFVCRFSFAPTFRLAGNLPKATLKDWSCRDCGRDAHYWAPPAVG